MRPPRLLRAESLVAHEAHVILPHVSYRVPPVHSLVKEYLGAVIALVDARFRELELGPFRLRLSVPFLLLPRLRFFCPPRCQAQVLQTFRITLQLRAALLFRAPPLLREGRSSESMGLLGQETHRQS